MPVISNLDHVVLQLRKQLADKARREGLAPRKKSAALAEPASLLDSVGTQASAVHQAGGDARAIVRVALEEILLADFGASFRNDAGFIDIVERVADALFDNDVGSQFASVIDNAVQA